MNFSDKIFPLNHNKTFPLKVETDASNHFEVETDASNHCIVATLNQQRHPVTFFLELRITKESNTMQ